MIFDFCIVHVTLFALLMIAFQRTLVKKLMFRVKRRKVEVLEILEEPQQSASGKNTERAGYILYFLWLCCILAVNVGLLVQHSFG